MVVVAVAVVPFLLFLQLMAATNTDDVDDEDDDDEDDAYTTIKETISTEEQVHGEWKEEAMRTERNVKGFRRKRII